MNTDPLMSLLHIGGGHPRNIEFIQRACKLFNITYYHTNNTEIPNEGHTIIWSPMSWIDPDRYPSSKILFGPHFWVFPNPTDPLFIKATPDHAKRCVYLCLSDWNKQVYTEFIPESRQIIPFVPIPFGLDIEAKPKGTSELDCIIYFKARHPALLNACKAFVESKGLRYKVYSYGSYTREEYVDTLRKTHFAIWIGSHESQGFGLQECLATGTPIYLWDVTTMKEEWYSGFSYQQHSERLLATSAPYWSDDCGLKVYSQAEFEMRFDEFHTRLPSYHPADYVSKTLTDRVCFQRFLDALSIRPTLYVLFQGFWSGFHERTNPVHEGFFLDLFKDVYKCDIQVGDITNATILVENTQVEQSLRLARPWLHTYLFSGESYLRSDASYYTCVLYGQRTHANRVNVPLFVPYLACQGLLQESSSSPVTTVPPNQVLAIISNPHGHVRNRVCDAIEQSGIKIVYAGHFRNNIGGSFNAQYNTPEFRDYVRQFKFLLSMENSEEDTYITEKITHGLVANSIPIYWGSKQVSHYFNRERFLELQGPDDIGRMIHTIKTMTDEEWLRRVNEKPFANFYTLQTIGQQIRNLLYPSPFPHVTQVFIICNPAFEPERYARCRAMCSDMGLTEDHVTFLCPTYKHMMTPEIMAQYVKEDLVRRMRWIGTKKGELSLTLNWRAVMEHIVMRYRDGTFLILESDAFPLANIGGLNGCLEALKGKRWDAINIGGPNNSPLGREAFLGPPHRTPYRECPNIPLLMANSAEDLSKEGYQDRFIRKFMTRCTDSQLWSYEGCVTFYQHMITDQNYGVPFDYYLTNKTEMDMNFKYYWSSISYFDQRSNLGLENTVIQGDQD
jgi:hypothetical protein